MFSYFIIIFTLVIALFICAFLDHAKKSNSDIIRIEDIEMAVTVRNRSTSRDLHRNHIDYDYNVTFEAVDDYRKVYRSSSKNMYKKYRVGDKATLQEVVYHNKGEIFSEITFANSKHYERLDQYNSKNRNTTNLNREIDYILNERYDKQHNFRKVFSIFFAILFICGAIYFIQEFNKTNVKIHESSIIIDNINLD